MPNIKYNKKTFVDVWNEFDAFKEDYNASEIKASSLAEVDIKKIYYLLYAQYGNSPITNFDENQFKYKVYSIITIYGDEWKRKLLIQDSLRNLTDEELMKGGQSIINHANNPSVSPSTEGTGELGYVDDQTVQKNKRGKIDAYSYLWDMLNSNITKTFIDRFKPLFSKFVGANIGIIYCNPDSIQFDGNDEDDNI